MRKIINFAILFSIAMSNYANAGTTTNNFKSTATLSSSCSVNIGNLNFGTILPGQESSTTTSTINVLCTKGTSYNFNISYPTDGTDCPLMNGLTKGDKIYYSSFIGSVMQAWNQPNNAVGTGAIDSYSLKGVVQPTVSTWPTNNGCRSRTSIYTGFNPYVTPDNYSGNATLNLNY